MNDFFGSVFTQGSSIEPDIGDPVHNSHMPEIEFDVDTIERKLNSLDVNKSKGPDEIPSLILKKFSNLFAKILTLIYTKSYKEGKVPIQMKQANVIPLYKSGDRNLPNNFRPVSLTPIIAKTFESCIYDHLSEYINKNNIITDLQHGFRKNHSTNSNLLMFWDDISALANKGNEISMIYTDLRKAFDSVPHDLLLLKLRKYGVSGLNLSWIKSFLTNRQQTVVINGHKSHAIHVESGVPQGGVLSGLLFNIYINDMPQIFEYVNTSLYADDAKLYASANSTEDIVKIQKDLDKLASWCEEWRLRLNVQKCFFLHYVPQKKTSCYPDYNINGIELQRKQETSDLGIMVSDNLKFHSQVSQACKKATREINRIRRTFISLSPDFLSNMFEVFVRPHLEYCVQVWNPVYVGDIEMMEKVQNRYTRLLRHGNILTHEQRNKLLNITSHQTRRLRGDLIYTYKLLNSTLFTPSYETRTRGHTKKISVELSRNNIRMHSFAVRSVAAWNSLPEHIVSAETLECFKARLDEHMTNIYT